MEARLHSTVDELEMYALDRLAGADSMRLEEHLIVCATCRERFDEIEACATGLRDALLTNAGADEDSGWDLLSWLRRPAVSMALAFAALLAVMGILSRGPAALADSVSMQIPASAGAALTAKPTRELKVTIREALPDSGPFRVEVLTNAGERVWSGLAAAGSQGVEVDVQQRLTTGDYLLRVFSVGGEKLKDYAFRVG